MRRSLLPTALLAIAVAAALLLPARATAQSNLADFDLPVPFGGHFYTQTDAGASGTGFAVGNADGIPFWTYFQQAGGVQAVGYPVSHRFVYKGFVVQAFQKVVFQWRPEVNTVYYLNTLDEMHNAGLDGFLQSVRQTPPPSDWSGDTGLPFSQVMQRHLALPDANPAIQAAAMSPQVQPSESLPGPAGIPGAVPPTWDWNVVPGPSGEPFGDGGNWGLKASRFPQAWNLLAGYSGLVSLASAAFVGLGEYATAWTTIHAGMPLLPALLIFGAVGAGFPSLTSVPMFRFRGLYFTIGTLVPGEALLQFMINFNGLGGNAGLTLTNNAPTDGQLYQLTLLLTVLATIALVVVRRLRLGSALLAHPAIRPVLRGTFVPTIHFNKDFLAMIVAVIGTSLSAYIFTWQANEEVEEKIAAGRRRLWAKRGTSRAELKQSMWDIVFGMFFANAVMYVVILSTASTLFKAGKTDINSAADAAQALRPLPGDAAGVLFTLGVIGVGFLAVPVMTTGAAYDLCQSTGWKNGLYRKPAEAKKFYITIAIFTFIAVGLNFFGINPMKALVLAGIVQGLSTPPVMLLIMRMTNNPAIMGARVNGRKLNIVGWITTIAIFAATAGLIISWFV